MKIYDTASIRNVALVGHGGSGKTSLTSAILFDAGAVNRLGKVEEGNTVTDFDADEIARQISLSTALAHCEWNKTKLNLLDTPGYGNFIQEARVAIHVADAALVNVCGVAGRRGPDGEGLGIRRVSAARRAYWWSTASTAIGRASVEPSSRSRNRSAEPRFPCSFRWARRRTSAASSIWCG